MYQGSLPQRYQTCVFCDWLHFAGNSYTATAVTFGVANATRQLNQLELKTNM